MEKTYFLFSTLMYVMKFKSYLQIGYLQIEYVYGEEFYVDSIIKAIIFAIFFPLGMSLIYGLRKKLKGSKVIFNFNFVKVARKNYIFIGIINALLFPFGIMGILAVFYEVSILFSTISKVDWEVFILAICLTALDSYSLHLLLSFRNKIEIIDNESIKIFKGRKSVQLKRTDITYKCVENVIRIYNKSGKRIISITHLYENTQSLINWLEKSNETIKNLNDLFYEDNK